MALKLKNMEKKAFQATAIAVSILFHALLLSFRPLQKSKGKPHIFRSSPMKVQIVVSTPKAQAGEGKTTLENKSSRTPSSTKAPSTKLSKDVPQKQSGPKSDFPQTKRYSALLPQAGELSVPSASSASERPGRGQEDKGEGAHGPYYGEVYQNVMIESHILQGIFDIPLFLRQQANSASASLEVEPLDETSLNLKLLSGDPYLRALIWECLKNPKATASLKRIAEATGEKFLAINLSYASQNSPDPTAPRYIEDIRLEKAKVFIKVTLNKDQDYGPQWGGISLPDKDAKLAVTEDRMRISALANSRAFQHVLRDETVDN